MCIRDRSFPENFQLRCNGSTTVRAKSADDKTLPEMSIALEGEEWPFPTNGLASYWRDARKLLARNIAELVSAKAKKSPATEATIVALTACPVALRVAVLKGADGVGLFLVAAVGDYARLNESAAKPASTWMACPVPVMRRNDAFLFLSLIHI